MSNPNGQVVNRQHSGGRSVSECWCYLFENNEERFGRGEPPWTDEEITSLMLKFFPDRHESQVFRRVGHVRAAYNRGALSSQKGRRPRRPSRRYVPENGAFLVYGKQGKRI